MALQSLEDNQDQSEKEDYILLLVEREKEKKWRKKKS